MKFNSLSRLAGVLWSRKASDERRRKGRRSNRARPVLETLEDRTLLSVLPPALVTGHTVTVNGVVQSSLTGTSTVNGTNTNHNTPAIAYDPVNTRHLVTVFSSNNLSAGGT